ncbi:MAG: tetratricopeptide repeat protein [Planctomycetota bacterium]
MAAKDPPEKTPPSDGPSPAKRKRLQQCFEHANVQMQQENHDYATELFTQCVAGDPSNFIYLQSFLSNLKKKYNNNRKGSNLAFIQGRGARSGAKKATSQQDWPGVITAGLDALKLNPWDVATLSIMADASNRMGNHDCQLAYLKTAQEANPKDPHVNRLCAVALRELGQFDQAIACWHRVEQAKPGDEEAARSIASLAVEKTIAKGGYEDPNRTSESLRGQQQKQQTQTQPDADHLSPEKRLEKEIARHPDDISKYHELAELYISHEQYDRAIEVYARAFEASDGDEEVRERWEDAQLRHLRQRAERADREAKRSGDDEAKQRCEELRRELVAKELEVHQNRVKRYPTNLTFRYDLGLRYQMNGRYNEAIAEYQQARNDPRRRGLCMLALGQCFQQIKQFRLAMSHYEEAIQEIPDRDSQNKKLALYLAGRLAAAMKNFDVGEKHLTTLAGLDFSYRDVSTLLDKIAKLRDNQGGDGEEEGNTDEEKVD